jgi:hypothetical protein
MTKLQLTIDGNLNSIDLPTGWDEINLSTYRKLLSMDQDLPEFTKNILTISIILGVDIEVVREMYKEDFDKIVEEIKFIFSEEIGTERYESIEVDGEEFFLYHDFTKLTMGEQESINILITKSNGNIMEVYNELLCLLLRKKDENGKLETFKSYMMERASLFDKVPISKINGLLVFFLNSEES